VIAAHDAWLAPEGVGHHAQIQRGRGTHGVEGRVRVARPGRHDQRAPRAESGVQGLDEAQRPALHRPHGPERRVHQEHAPRSHAEDMEVLDDL